MTRSFSLYLDAVRLFAALLVILYHANSIFNPGFAIANFGHEAVVIFFVLSGFVIAYVKETKEATMKEFLIARAARIFSVALPAIALTALLDFIGFGLSESVYPESYQAWDYPFIRALSSTFFLNEIWGLGIQLFSNAPYWSLNYEVWYYIAFGIIAYVEGRRRWLLFSMLCLVIGPKIILLMPVWWMGVVVYHSRLLARLSNRSAWICLTVSVLGMYSYITFNLGQLGWDYLHNLLGEQRHTQLSFSKKFVSDYFLGLMLALHFAALRILLDDTRTLPKHFESSIRYLAGATFSLYLFHQPLLWFYSAVFENVQSAQMKYLIVLPLTILTAYLLSIYTERKKHLWKAGLERLIRLSQNILQRQVKAP